MEEGNDSTVQQGEEGNKPKAVIPPTVITVDTSAQKEGNNTNSGSGSGSGGNNNGPSGEGTAAAAAAASAASAGGPPSRSHGGGGGSISDAASQARTPKHANKNPDEQKSRQYEERDREELPSRERDTHGPPSHYPSSSFPPPPRPFDGRLGGSGAFQPHDRHSGYGGRSLPPMQVSPGGGGGGGRYYPGPSSGYGAPPSRYGPHGGPPPPPPLPSQYDQHYPPHGPHPGFQRPYGGPPPPPPPPGPMYPGQQYPGSYEGGGPSWGHPPSFPHGRPPSYPNAPPPHHMPPEYATRHAANTSSSTFSRAVSSSFDRSIKSREDSKMSTGSGHHGHTRHRNPNDMDVSPHFGPQPPPPAPHHHHHHHGPHHGGHHHEGDDRSLSGDASWGQLNQVTSVDEEEMRKRLSRRDDTPEADKEVAVTRSQSNSSSLTNSPTEGVDVKKPAKLPSSLDSLSSVASAQAPMDTQKAGRKSQSPSANSSASLDLNLMKCPSGSSALLLPSHQRHDSAFSFSAETHVHQGGIAGKRSHDEEREDVGTSKVDNREMRKAPPVEPGSAPRPSKTRRVDGKDKTKSSPLSIECSPPTSPSGDRRKVDPKIKQPQPYRHGGGHPHHQGDRDRHHERGRGEHHKEPIDSFYDKAPSYTYSMDSAPTRERDSSQPARPGSSSSTITPMNVTDSAPDHRQPAVGQMPSWDLQPQDSFGAASAGGPGGALMSSFSFSQDYPMLAASTSIDHGHPPMDDRRSMPEGPHGPGIHPSQALESRNQSFEGGHYHGSFSRSDSMMSYEGHPSGMSYEGRPSYQGPYPPHASSWGSASSYPQGHPGYGGHGQYQNYPPPMMRNYSEDSAARTSPPHGPHGMRGMMHRGGFQPPPEFRAPPSMVPKSGPQTQHIISSPYGGPKGGSYGWSKEEDMRLTEIMKKYKNPRDWDPVAKEHSCGRTAKECHERWIRYLKPGVRKGQWTDQEDAIVMEVVTTSSEQPFTRWSDLAQRLPGRVGKQIRDRWVNHLNPNINHLPFSREDDLLLWEGHKKLGKRWVEISTKYFNSSRSENHIKNRWYSASFKKFISNEFGPDAYSGGKAGKKESPSKKKKEKSGGGSSPQGKRPSLDASNVEAV